MTSAIDPTKPVYGKPTTQSVRDNFYIAQAEITTLQNNTTNAPFLPLNGGLMNGPLYLQGDPVDLTEPVTLNYFLAHNSGGGGGGSGGGIPEAPIDNTAYGRSNAAWKQVIASGDIIDGGNF